MPESAAYRWIESGAELRRFREDWRVLWTCDPIATPFQSPEWLLPWWDCFGQKDLRALAIYKRGGLIGLLPFYIYPEPASQERRLLMLGVGTSDYLDGLFAPGCTGRDIRTAMDLLLEREGWDSLSVSQLRPESRLLQAMHHPAVLRPEHFGSEPCSRMAAVRVQKLPRKIRANAFYYLRRAQRLAKVEFSVAGAKDIESVRQALVDLHTARWEARGEPGVFADARVVEWHRKALPDLQQNGILRLSTLRIDGEIAAILYSLIDPPTRADRSLYVYITAFSSKHADHRPGTLLLADAIDRAAAEGVRTVDMLRGKEGYKHVWHTERCPTFGFTVCRERMAATTSEAAA